MSPIRSSSLDRVVSSLLMSLVSPSILSLEMGVLLWSALDGSWPTATLTLSSSWAVSISESSAFFLAYSSLLAALLSSRMLPSLSTSVLYSL